MNKSKKSNKKKKAFNREISGILIMTIGILSLISLFSEKTGVVGKILKSIYLQLMGFGGYIFPLIIFSIGLLLVINKLDVNEDRRAIKLMVIFLCLIVVLDIKGTKINGFSERISFALENSQKGFGGGIIGAIFGYFFYKLFGTIGSYILLFSIAFANFLMLTDTKLKDIFNKMFYRKPKIRIKDNSSTNINKTTEKNIVQNKKPFDENQNSEIKILEYSNSRKLLSEDKPQVNESDKINITNTTKLHENYQFPPIELLKEQNNNCEIDDKKEIITNAKKIEETMKSFGIEANIVQISKGPAITCYELQPAAGVKVSKIVALSDDIALNLASSDVRIEAPIPGKAAVGIEVPNKHKLNVGLREILLSDEFKEINSNVPFALGKDIAGKPIITNIEKMPHLLIAGATGSGKSVCINTIIMSILYRSSPDEVKLLMIDPKVVELSIYNGIPHLLIPVVTDAKKARNALNWAVEEMTKRYKLFAKNNVRDIYSYNNKVGANDNEKRMPQIIIIIDELADLMMVSAQEIEDYICRLAQMARAAGMYLIVATQRPSVDVITGTIKANIPSRISFAVTSQADSRTILDMGGAEKLLGKGDMLFYPSGAPKPVRVQGAFIDEEEVEKVVDFLKPQNSEEYDENIIEVLDNQENFDDEDSDQLLPEAIEMVIREGQASISLLQRRLKIGYARAARLIDEMEKRGVVGGYEGSKPRKVLIDEEEFNSMQERS